jgi:hypothetical protein
VFLIYRNMRKTTLTKEELQELELLEVRGGTSSDSMAQFECVNSAKGCGKDVTQYACTNTVFGCGGPSTSTEGGGED